MTRAALIAALTLATIAGLGRAVIARAMQSHPKRAALTVTAS